MPPPAAAGAAGHAGGEERAVAGCGVTGLAMGGRKGREGGQGERNPGHAVTMERTTSQ